MWNHIFRSLKVLTSAKFWRQLKENIRALSQAEAANTVTVFRRFFYHLFTSRLQKSKYIVIFR